MFWLLLAVSCLLMGYGGLSIMGGAMSDAPALGESEAKTGGILFLIGLALLIFGIVARHHGWLPV